MTVIALVMMLVHSGDADPNDAWRDCIVRSASDDAASDLPIDVVVDSAIIKCREQLSLLMQDRTAAYRKEGFNAEEAERIAANLAAMRLSLTKVNAKEVVLRIRARAP